MEEDGPPPRPAVAADVVARVTSGTAAAPREEPATVVANVRSLTQFYILGFLTTVTLFCTEGDLNKISNNFSLNLNIFHSLSQLLLTKY